MDIQINDNTYMNMQSKGCKVYNEAIFLMPYNTKNKVDESGENKVHIWHAGIVSYMLMDFNSQEISNNLPKYIVEHGHKSVMMDKEEACGTLKQFPEYSDVLKFIKYSPDRPLSFFEVYTKYNTKPWDLEEEINTQYIASFDEKNHQEISEKLTRAYANTLAIKDQLMKGHNDRLIIYYGEPNQIFLDILAEKSGLKDNKICEFKGLGISDKKD
jgi:hypothetical protein